MTVFSMPSDLFRWCLMNIRTGHDTFSYDACFPAYLAVAKGSNYLWETYDRRLLELIKEVRPGLRILEVGCGFGHDLHWAAVQGAEVVGIDVRSDFVEIARRLTPEIEKVIGRPLHVDILRTNLLDMPDRETFDFIYMKDVFHHLEPRANVIAKLSVLLSPGGRILIVEPNAWNPLIQYQMFRIRGFNTIVEKVDPATGERFVFGNERLVTGGAMRRAFAMHGVKGWTRTFRLLPSALTGHVFLGKL